uniref:Zinc finger protein 541 n=1 Tax=Latimeria chalumnae TaxID=7897 RepID=H3AZ55_LATCH
MNCYQFGDESSIQADLHLPQLSDSNLPCAGNNQRLELGSDPEDIMYTGLSSLDLEPGFETSEITTETFEKNFENLFGVSKNCDILKVTSDSTDSESPSPFRDTGPMTPKAHSSDSDLSRLKTGSVRRGRRHRGSPQNQFQECSLCGKMFSSASSLSKHYLTHSHERKHVCKICTKAFKRQDHLTGHLLTHQKTKPFVCTEQGCSKSYCDYRSLRRHCEVQHGMCTSKDPLLEEAAQYEGSLCSQAPLMQPMHDDIRSPEKQTLDSKSLSPNSVLPHRDLLRCLVSSFATHNFPSGAAGQSNAAVSFPSQSSAAIQAASFSNHSDSYRETLCSEMLKDFPCQETALASNLYTVINPNTLSLTIPDISSSRDNIASDTVDSTVASKPQIPLEPVESVNWSNSGIVAPSLSRAGHASGSVQQTGQNLQWIKNMPVHSGSKQSHSYINYQAPALGTDIPDGSSSALQSLSAFTHSYGGIDAIPCSPLASRKQGEPSGEIKFNVYKDSYRPAELHDTNISQWPNLAEQNLQFLQKQNLLQKKSGPLLRQLLLTDQESLEHQEPESQVTERHLFQMMATSQQYITHTQKASPSQVAVSKTKQLLSKSTQNVLKKKSLAPVQHHSGLVQPFQTCRLHEGSQIFMQAARQSPKTMSPSSVGQVQAVGSGLHTLKRAPEPYVGSENGPFVGQPRSSSENYKTSDNSFPTGQLQVQPPQALYEDLVGNLFDVNLGELESTSLLTSSISGNQEDPSKEAECRLYSGSSRPRRSVSARKDRLKFNLGCTASPSQVAMASFSAQSLLMDKEDDTRSKMTIYNRIQGGNIYSLSRDGTMPVLCDQASTSASAAWKDSEESFICKNCHQVFYTQKGLNSHFCFHSEQWQSPQDSARGQQTPDTGVSKVRRLLLKPAAIAATSPLKKAFADPIMTPLIIPVSVPVKPVNKNIGSLILCNFVFSPHFLFQVAGGESQSPKTHRGTFHPKKEKKRPRPQALFIPPVLGTVQPASGVLYQSQLRSPEYLADHLLEEGFQAPPYTPPPMLSPIRQGSGLYFNTICPTCDNSASTKSYIPVTDAVVGVSGISLVRDDIVINVEPHINIGSRFQAEIPVLRDRSYTVYDEHRADLVWKPWGNTETNEETQQKVTDLLSLSCSSAVPGGGSNLELALHCLHETKGDILGALEILLITGPQRHSSHPLRDYHYIGTDFWTPVEKRLFKKAFLVHNKDFYFIQKMIQTKTVSQCVEYYYAWKKLIKFEQNRAQVADKGVKKEQMDTEEQGTEKAACSINSKNSLSQNQGVKKKPRKPRARPECSSAVSLCSQKGGPERPPSADNQSGFACKECGRVFEKIKSRNAHMKRHRQQEDTDMLIKVKWPTKRLKLEQKVKIEEEAAADIYAVII